LSSNNNNNLRFEIGRSGQGKKAFPKTWHELTWVKKKNYYPLLQLLQKEVNNSSCNKVAIWLNEGASHMKTTFHIKRVFRHLLG